MCARASPDRPVSRQERPPTTESAAQCSGAADARGTVDACDPNAPVPGGASHERAGPSSSKWTELIVSVRANGHHATSQWGGVRPERVILVLVILLLAVVITLVYLVVVSNTRDTERLSGPLPIDLPDTSELQNSPKKVFAHYFPPYPLSLDNKPAQVDYYTRNYLDPQGEGGRHAEYGGLLRERPLPVPVGNPHSWRLDNMKTEITRAGQAGI